MYAEVCENVKKQNALKTRQNTLNLLSWMFDTVMQKTRKIHLISFGQRCVSNH